MTVTIDEIRASDKAVLTPADVAEVLGSDPQTIRLAAKRHPEQLGFNVAVVGCRVKIPKEAFLRFLTGEGR